MCRIGLWLLPRRGATTVLTSFFVCTIKHLTMPSRVLIAKAPIIPIKSLLL